MRTIHQFPIRIGGPNTIEMPAGAEPLSVQLQATPWGNDCRSGMLQLWALVDTDRPMVPVDIEAYGTGHEIPDNPGRHLGTVQTHGGRYVCHVFARNLI